MKRTPLILAAIIVALLASLLLWNFSMQAAGPAGRGAKKGSAANDPENAYFDIRRQTLYRRGSKVRAPPGKTLTEAEGEERQLQVG